MRILIDINDDALDNDAFGDTVFSVTEELDRILKDAFTKRSAKFLVGETDEIQLFDINGNYVGRIIREEE